MPMEFYQGRPLEPDGPEAIRQQIEQFDTIEAIDPEMRGIVERNWPHLVANSSAPTGIRFPCTASPSSTHAQQTN